MSAQERLCLPPRLDLSLADYNVKGASINWSSDGTTFSFTIWPLARATADALEAMAKQQQRIRLYCRGRPLLLDLAVVERQEPKKVRIVGHIVDANALSVACNQVL